jgi:hypothetical protein
VPPRKALALTAYACVEHQKVTTRAMSAAPAWRSSGSFIVVLSKMQ